MVRASGSENYFEFLLVVTQPSVVGEALRFQNFCRTGLAKHRVEDMGMFDIGTTRYGGDFDVADQNSPHAQLVMMVGPNKRVLEV